MKNDLSKKNEGKEKKLEDKEGERKNLKKKHEGEIEVRERKKMGRGAPKIEMRKMRLSRSWRNMKQRELYVRLRRRSSPGTMAACSGEVASWCGNPVYQQVS